MLKKLVENSKYIITTSVGIVGSALIVLTTLGYITLDQSNILFANANNIIVGIMGLTLIFVAKD